MTGTSHNGGEDSPGGVVSGKAGLAHAGAIVTDKSGNVLVTHLGCFEPGGDTDVRKTSVRNGKYCFEKVCLFVYGQRTLENQRKNKLI